FFPVPLRFSHALLYAYSVCTGTAATAIYPLSLHDALPISSAGSRRCRSPRASSDRSRTSWAGPVGLAERHGAPGVRVLQVIDSRSEEHTSELQSRENLVCRLLLEKKKYRPIVRATWLTA